MSKQIYGYTPAGVAAEGQYVRYLDAHLEPNGRIKFGIRGDNGEMNVIELPPSEAWALADEIRKCVTESETPE